jgi:hypothetical protein
MSDSSQGPKGRSRVVAALSGELIVALILAATVVATSWSAFQAGKWGAVMTVAFNEASENRAIAASDLAQAGRDVSADRATFSSFVLAFESEDDDAARIIFLEFRDEVQPLIESWMAMDPFTNPDVGSPFDRADYSAVETLEAAADALTEAESSTTVALEAKANAGNYTLATVTFAIVLFLAGMARQFETKGLKIAITGVAGVLMILGVATLIALPTLV